MDELQEELDAINFAEADELSLVIGVGWRTFLKCIPSLWLHHWHVFMLLDDGALSPAPLACARSGLFMRRRWV